MHKTEDTGGGCLKTLAMIGLTVVVSVSITFWVLTRYIFPQEFTPVTLSKKEKSTLQTKLEAFRGWTDTETSDADTNPALRAEKYSENDQDRYIELSQRELNSILANNTDLGQTLAIDLSRDLASAKLLIPLNPDLPVMGGKTLKLSAGLELSYANHRPIIILKGVSVMGVPVPNAWLGGLKDADLISEFGHSGFWQTFAEGVDLVKVEDSKLIIKLKE